MTPLRAIALHCLACSSGDFSERKLCVSEACPLYNYHLGRGKNGLRPTPLQAVKLWCAVCIGEGPVRLCAMKECPLIPYRMGKNPARKGLGGKGASAEQMARIGKLRVGPQSPTS